MIIEEKTKAKYEIDMIGGSFYFKLSPEIREYLSIEKTDKVVNIMFDRGKHGRYIAIWKAD